MEQKHDGAVSQDEPWDSTPSWDSNHASLRS